MQLWNPYEVLQARTGKLLPLLSVALVLLAWAAVSASGLVAPSRLPSPLAVAKAFVYLSWNSSTGHSVLLTSMGYSLSRIVISMCLVLTVGIPVGVMMGASPKLNAFISPLVDPFRSAPIVAILPIMVMWFGIGEGMKIAFLFAGSVVYLVPMVRDAVRAVPQEYWVSARDLNATDFEAVRSAVLPMAMPRIVDAIITSTSVMWTYITVAEFVNAKQGLGQMIQNSGRFSAMDQVFAGIIVIVTLALITYNAMQWLKGRLYPWETQI